MKRTSLWEPWRARLEKLTAAKGMKTALAKKFHVSQAAVSKWLSGDNIPSAETALQLIDWVREMEGCNQLKALGAINTKGKWTRNPNPSHELKKQSPKKR